MSAKEEISDRNMIGLRRAFHAEHNHAMGQVVSVKMIDPDAPKKPKRPRAVKGVR